MNSIGARVKEKRQELHLTIRQLAALCNIYPSTLSKIEGDQQVPNSDTLIKLASQLQTSPNYLCGYTDDSTPPTLHLYVGNIIDSPAPSVQHVIDNYNVTDSNLSSFLQDEFVYIMAHIDNLQKSGKYDPVGDVKIARSLSKKKGKSNPQDIGKSELIKNYEALFNTVFDLCNTGTGNHSKNVQNMLSFIKTNSSRIGIK